MWSPLSGGHLHCKLGAIWIRHHGATCGWKLLLCCSRQYTEVPFWAAQHATVCLDKSGMHAFESLLTHTEQEMRAEKFSILTFTQARCWTYHTPHTHTHTHTHTHAHIHTHIHTHYKEPSVLGLSCIKSIAFFSWCNCRWGGVRLPVLLQSSNKWHACLPKPTIDWFHWSK